MTITVDARTCYEALGELAKESRAESEADLVAKANKIAEVARRNVRVGTPPHDPHPGRLRENIEVSELHREATESWIEVGASTDKVPEALTEEYGRHNEAAHPWLRPAVAQELR